MSCVDVAKQAGYNPHPMSFSQVVSSTLGIVLESLRQNNIVPRRDGFEYADMMRHWDFDVKADRVAKLGITKALQFSTMQPLRNVALNPALNRLRVRFDELASRWNADPENMGPYEIEEMNRLALELNPE